MRIEAKRGRFTTESSSEVALIGQFEGEGVSSGALKGMEPALAGQFVGVLESGEFEGKYQQWTQIRAKVRTGLKRLLIVGLGKRPGCSLEKIRRVCGKAAQQVRELGLKRFCSPLLVRELDGASTAQIAQAMVEGAILGLYRFNVYKTEAAGSMRSVAEFTILDEDSRRLGEIREGIHIGRILAEATGFARDLGNYPSNYATPTRLTEIAQDMAGEVGLQCEILEKPQMEALGMGALLGVAQGSQEPPKFIILKYQGEKVHLRPIALVGKTITFDSGGISLKPSERMEQMKYDMMGGAAVMGALKAVAQLKPAVNVVGFLPTTENMPSGTAIKPGDVVKTLSGKTVEVINTDAEGRLILADALAYATRYRPAAIIDLATLTGACTVALGHHAAGLLGNDRPLLDAIKEASEVVGERVWELPLWEEHYEQIKSDIADIKNVGSRGAGTITAAAFLSKFVGEYPWAHLDIASTAWAEESRPDIPKGATGVGVRLLACLLNDPRRVKQLSRTSASSHASTSRRGASSRRRRGKGGG